MPVCCKKSQDSVVRAGFSPVLPGFGARSDMGLPTGLGQTPTVKSRYGNPAQSHPSNEQVLTRDSRELHEGHRAGCR